MKTVIHYSEERKRWYFRKSFNGKRVYKSFKTKTQAIHVAKMVEQEIKRCKEAGLDCYKNQYTIENLYEEYKTIKFVKPSTLKGYEILFRLHFDLIKEEKLNTINVNKLRIWINSIPEYSTRIRRNHFTNTTSTTISKSGLRFKCVSLMRSMLKYATENKYCSLIPSSWYEGIKKPRRNDNKINQKTLSYKQTIELINVLENEDLKNLTKGKTWDNNKVAFVCKVLLYTGVRYGEARALKKSDFHLGFFGSQSCYICEIKHQMDDEGNIVPVKNSDNADNGERIVPLTKEVYNGFMKFMAKYDDNQYIFDFEGNGKTPRRNSFPRVLQKYIGLAKSKGLLPETFPQDISNHSFRRTNTKYLYKVLGLPFEVTAKIQGHTREVMLESYISIDQEEKTLSVFAI